MLPLEAPSIVINKHVALVLISLPLESVIVVLLDKVHRGVEKAFKGRVGRHGQGARRLGLRDTGQELAEC